MSPGPLYSGSLPMCLGLESGWNCACSKFERSVRFPFTSAPGDWYLWTVVLGVGGSYREDSVISEYSFLMSHLALLILLEWALLNHTTAASTTLCLHPLTHTGHCRMQPSFPCAHPLLLPSDPYLLVLILCLSLLRQRKETDSPPPQVKLLMGWNTS